jgi:hypothetical protein
MTSAQISCIMPTLSCRSAPALSCAILPVSRSQRATCGRQSACPSPPAPEVFHLSCQVRPGWAASQSRTLISPNLR